MAELARLLSLVLLVVAQSAGEPGLRSLAHRDLGGFPVGCNKCHESGYGVPDEKCLACHTHQPLRERIRAGKGFHSDESVKKKPCKQCHAEHKGQRSTIDWRDYGGKANFNHRLTGWPLDGQHRFQECEKCHFKKYPETKLPTYLDQRSECTTCHFGAKKNKGAGGYNPHAFTDVARTDCRLCHDFNAFKIANVGATKFDHDATAFPLVGFHQKAKCIQCHQKNIETFAVERFDDCRACHQDSHRSIISATRKCSDCHAFETKFEKTKFDHAKETRFPLRGEHQKNRCRQCHLLDSSEKPKMECSGCHRDPHQKRFGKEACEGCHTEVGFASIIFDHGAKTKLALTGKHETTKCTNCHRGGIAQGFERHSTTDCASCHRHQRAHCGQFGLKNCERCHVRGGDRTSKFDHDLTRFPLQRAHARVECMRCHQSDRLGDTKECRNAVKYTGLDPQCAGCHVDIHEGELGKDCAKCHTGGESFKTLAFDHNRDSRFSLTGFHQLVKCDVCHPARKYKIEKSRCHDCHANDDVHEKSLGDDCAKCHETTGGAPKFDHNVHTDFPQQGVHARIECMRCHFLEEPIRIDLSFRSAGTDCMACHPDPHAVREKLACDQCHDFEKWRAPPRNGYHSSAGFELTGAHTIVACSKCHIGAGNMRGRGVRCGTCHVQDDIHAGSFGSECGSCHLQDGWIPTTFTHVDTGYVLEGLHRTLECRQCHLAGNYFIGKDPKCYQCHLGDWFRSDWHQQYDLGSQMARADAVFIYGTNRQADRDRAVAMGASFDCDVCHNQFSFPGAMNWLPP